MNFCFVQESEYKLKVRIESLGDANTLNVFERVSVRADTVAAAITVGRVFIWWVVYIYVLNSLNFTKKIEFRGFN